VLFSFRSQSLEFITCQHSASVNLSHFLLSDVIWTFYFQSAYPLQLPTLPRTSLSMRLDSSKTLALYKSRTYLFTITKSVFNTFRSIFPVSHDQIMTMLLKLRCYDVTKMHIYYYDHCHTLSAALTVLIDQTAIFTYRDSHSPNTQLHRQLGRFTTSRNKHYAK